MTELGERLVRAAKEAIAITSGEADPKTYIVHASPRIVRRRQKSA